jgi:lysophospholipase L1-like esterase
MRSAVKVGVALASIATLFEIAARVSGLGYPVLSQKDEFCAYRFRPNQRRIVLGKHISYNRWSQRSPDYDEAPAAGRMRVYLIGDSVVNGGVATDQADTVGAKLERELGNAEVLSASAGSWGMQNELGYIREFGLFHSNVAVLEIGANDLDQLPSTSDRVGVSPDYPDHRPAVALAYVFERMLLPRLGVYQGPSEIPASAGPAQVDANVRAANEMVALFRQNSASAIVVYVPTSDNGIAGAKERFLSQLRDCEVVDFQLGWNRRYYRDANHLNETGNDALANAISRAISQARRPM